MEDKSTDAVSETSERNLVPEEPMLVDAVSERGFNYPYYLVVPDSVRVNSPGRSDSKSSESESTSGVRPILVEPHNVGQQIDDFEEHLEIARKRIENGIGRRIADELGAPFLIPIFPRPFEDPVDWTHMIHMLDAKTMALDDGPLERVDLQLLRMVEDAQQRLAAAGYQVPEELLLNGFSSQAAFVNRFAALHPDRVHSVSAGGHNGLLILPKERAEIRGFGDQKLNYPVGIANIGELTGEPFDLETFGDVYQFLYIGEDDDKDALLYPDAWTDPKLRAAAVLTYGEDIHNERVPYCQSVYQEFDLNAVFRVYEETGHTPEPAVSDVVEFHKRALAGESIETIRADLAGNVA